MKDTKRILNIASDHAEAMEALKLEAAQAGRRLTADEQSYLDELKDEHDQIMATADRASQQETLGSLGRIVTADTSGAILTKRDEVELQAGKAKAHVAGGGRLAD